MEDKILLDAISEALDIIKVEGIARLKAQGHDVTGLGINSIKNQVDKIGRDFIGSGYGAHYLLAQETGTKPFVKRERTGGYIEALVSWIENKGILQEFLTKNGKTLSTKKQNATSLAYAIAYTHKIKGMHTRNGVFAPEYQGWLSNTMSENQNKIRDIISKSGFDYLSTIIKTAIEEEKRNIQK